MEDVRGPQTDRGIHYFNYVSVDPKFEEQLVDELRKIDIIMKPVTSPNKPPCPRMILKYIENAHDYLKEMETLNAMIAKVHPWDVLVLILKLVNYPREPQNEQELHSFKSIVAQKAKSFDIAYDRATPDDLLRTATEFVSKELNIQLELVQNVQNQESPLLVICKNDSQLQEDIDDAKRKTRVGKDVMLLVVTASDNIRLVDTKATEGFGCKAKLKWDFHRKKFSRKDNQECIERLQTFFQSYGCDVRLSRGRIDSMKPSLRQNDSDKIGKDLQSKTNSDIFFKTDKEWTDEYIPFFYDRHPLSMKQEVRVVHLCCNSDKVSKMSNINSERPKETMAEANISSTSKTVKQDNAATPLPKECSVKNDDGNEEAFEKK